MVNVRRWMATAVITVMYSSTRNWCGALSVSLRLVRRWVSHCTRLRRSLPCAVSMATGRGIDPRSPWVVWPCDSRLASLGFTAARPAGASDRFSINVSLFIDRASPATAEMQNRSELIDFSVLPKSLYWLVHRRQRRPGSICKQRARRDADDDDDDDDDNLLAGCEVVTFYQAWLTANTNVFQSSSEKAGVHPGKICKQCLLSRPSESFLFHQSTESSSNVLTDAFF